MFKFLIFHQSLKYSSRPPPQRKFLDDRYFRAYRLIVSIETCHDCYMKHNSSNSCEWVMDCFYFIFPVLFKIITNVLIILWNIWYSDSQIRASKCIWKFKHLYNDHVNWSIADDGRRTLIYTESELCDLKHVNAFSPPEIQRE